MPNPKLPIRFVEKAIYTHQKTDLNKKSQVDTKLDQSICYLPYLGICKSQNMRVTTYCNVSNELLCLSELLYHSNMDLLAFLTVIWQHLQ